MALALGGCGGSSGYAGMAPTPAPTPPAPVPAPPPPGGALACGATSIAGNHGHALVIPAADVDSMVSIVYGIMAAADHNHLVTLTPAQLAQIKTKTAVTVTSGPASSGDGHTHAVTVNCA